MIETIFSILIGAGTGFLAWMMFFLPTPMPTPRKRRTYDLWEIPRGTQPKVMLIKSSGPFEYQIVYWDSSSNSYSDRIINF
jgi:hypothetical protein